MVLKVPMWLLPLLPLQMYSKRWAGTAGLLCEQCGIASCLLLLVDEPLAPVCN